MRRIAITTGCATEVNRHHKRILFLGLVLLGMFCCLPLPVCSQDYVDEINGRIFAQVRQLEQAVQAGNAQVEQEVLAAIEKTARKDFAAFPGERAQVLQFLAKQHGVSGRFDLATTYNQKAAETIAGLHQVFPDAALEVLMGQVWSALSHQKPQEALGSLRAATRVVETAYSRKSGKTAWILRQLSGEYERLGVADESQRLSQLAGQIESENLPDLGQETYRNGLWAILRGLLFQLDGLNAKETLARAEEIASGSFEHFPEQRVHALTKIALWALRFVDSAKCAELLNQAWAILAPLKKLMPSAHVEYLMAESALLSRVGEMQRAALKLSEAEALSAQVYSDDSNTQIETLISIGSYLGRAESPDRGAEIVMKAAESIAKIRGKQDPSLAQALVLAGWLNFQRGRGDLVLATGRKALAIVDSLPDDAFVKPYLGAPTNNGSQEFNAKLNRELKAQLRMSVLNQLAFAYESQKNRAEALKTLHQEAGVAEQAFGKQSEAYLTVLYNAVSFVNFNTPVDDSSLQATRELLSLLAAQGFQKHFLFLAVHLSLAQLYFEKGDYDRALEYYDLADQLRQDIATDPRLKWDIPLRQALVHLRAGRPREALKRLPYAVQGMEELQAEASDTPVANLAFLNHGGDITPSLLISYLVDLANEASLENSARENLLRLALRTIQIKSLRRLGTISLSGFAAQRKLAGDLSAIGMVKEYGDLQMLIRSTEAMVTKSLGAAQASDAELRGRLAGYLERAETLQRKLGEMWKAPAPAQLEEAQASLKPGEVIVLLNFQRVADGAGSRNYGHALVVGKDWLRATSLCFLSSGCSYEELEKLGADFRNLLSPSGRGALLVDDRREPSDMATGLRLSKILWEPVQQVLSHSETSRIFLIPDEPFYGLPFAALPVSCDKAAGKAQCWLADRYELAYLPSLRALPDLRGVDASSPPLSHRFVGFGDPLFYGEDFPTVESVRSAQLLDSEGGIQGRFARLKESAQEVCSMARVYAKANGVPVQSCEELTREGHPASRVYLRESASEATIHQLSDRGLLKSIDILAFATHGVVAGSNSGEPGILLTPGTTKDGSDDGFLSASEVMQLDLNANLVLLSACSTARSERMGSVPRELPSMTWAFFDAGARSVLATHLDVNSAAAVEIVAGMVTRVLAGGENRITALAKEIRRSIAEGRPPSYWAPFAYYGVD